MIRTLLRKRHGSVSILAAAIFPALLGMTGLGVEFGYGLLTKIENQRAADLAAYAGAVVYNSTGTTSSLHTAVANAVAFNGIPGSDATPVLVSSPTGDGNQAVRVTVTTNNPRALSRFLGTGTQLSVSASAFAEIKPNAAGCVIALENTGTGVTLSGGTSLSAPGCAVASNTTVAVPCGTTITTAAVDYGTSAPSEPCNGIQPPAGKSSVKIIQAVTADPLSGNSEVTGATGRIDTVASQASPNAPGVSSGGDIAFGWSQSQTQSQAAADGCSAAFSNSTWTLTCTGAPTFRFGNISLAGGITVDFNTGGASSTTYDFSGRIDNTGTALHFGPGTYNIAQGITTGGGTTTTFGAGTFNIGKATSGCSGGGEYSICNTGSSLVFGGPSTFVLSAGVYNNGGSTLTLGSGSTNSFDIGSSSDGNAIYAGGGSITTFADATGNGDLFQLVGNVNIASGGGSCLTLSAAAEHDINGNFATAGGTILGSGIYTVNGYVGLGLNGGGDVTCNGATVGMSGNGVTFVVSGASVPTSGTCSGQAFCVAAGYNHVTLTASTSGSTANLVVIGPTSPNNTAGATFAEGASNTSLSGAFYFPYGPVTLRGGASVGSGTGQCLELIGSEVTLSGGTALASTCLGGGASSASVVLVQ